MKHAVLVMAHGDLSVLQMCMEILDDERFDFFVHIDAKGSDDCQWLRNICKKSRVFLTERVPVYWGHHSQVEATLVLLKAALKAEHTYDYYHLISAVDMPLKTPDEFDAFFRNRPNDAEYVTIKGEEGSHDWRMNYRYPFLMRYKRVQSPFLNNAFKMLYTRILRFRRRPGTNIVCDQGLTVYMGDLWWSITAGFAKKLVSLEEQVMPFWRDCYVSDETFAQTLIMQYPEFNKCRTDEITRLIDWERGRPYTYQFEDFDLLMSSPALFARKFDPQNPEVAQRVYNAMIQKKSCE